jgi:ubiquinone/menaquinone biosynthesis C-methylase UbiE
MIWIWAAAGGCVLLFLYWALVLTEGAYLGRWVVASLYNWTASYYDRIKAITWREDDEWLIAPLLRQIETVENPLLLDVGTGTGRFPAALLARGQFEGQVWGLDISLGMLRRARTRLAGYKDRCTLIGQDADALPFPDQTFDAVVCLETIEFTPSPPRTVGELVRVLRPGGVLLISNRIGRGHWFPGRAYDDDQLLDLLGSHPLSKVQIHNWNSFYDLVWARKEGRPTPVGNGTAKWRDWLHNAHQYHVHEGIVQPR